MASFLRVCCAAGLVSALLVAALGAPGAPGSPAHPDVDDTIVWTRRGKGSKVRLRCPVEGLRPAERRAVPPHLAALEPEGSAIVAPHLHTNVTWWRDDKRLKETGEVLVLQGRKAGTYRCGVMTEGGLVLGTHQIVKNASLERTFTEEPAVTHSEEGQPAILSCRIQSSPPANITWRKDVHDLPLDNTRFILLKSGELLILNVTSHDSGNYSCRASNWYLNRTVTSRPAHLSVTRGTAQLEPAFLRPEVMEIRLRVGEELLLPCAVTGRPRPRVVWELPAARSQVGDTQVLRIPSVQLKDSGNYTCRLEHNLALTKRFDVSVLMSAKILLAPKSIRNVPSASTVRFNCSADGHPDPTITWYKNGRPLLLTGRVSLRQKSASSSSNGRMELVIGGVQPDDAGVYQCFAQSPGTAPVTAWAVLEVPGGSQPGPTDVRCRPKDMSTIHLDWQKMEMPLVSGSTNGSGVVYYTVSYMPEEGGVEQIKLPSQDPSASSMDISQLTPLAPHVFYVRAYIGRDASNISEKVVCQGQGVPVSATKLSNGSISISWSEAASMLSAVKTWMLQYRPVDTDEATNVTLDADVQSYVLPEVTSDDNYEVRLLASTTDSLLLQNLDLLTWTPTHNAQTDISGGCVSHGAVPHSLTVNQASTHTLHVSWRCDACESSSCYYSFIVCYKRFDPYNTLFDNRELCRHSPISELEAVGLEPGQQYQFKVQALVQGRARGGDFSENLRATTLLDESRRIQNVHYEYIGSEGLSVIWSDTEAKNGTVYTLHYSQNLTKPLDQWKQTNVTGRTDVELYGLDPGLKTYVMVSCRSSAQEEHKSVMEVPARTHKIDNYALLGIIAGSVVSLTCLICGAVFLVWRRLKSNRCARPRTKRPGVNGEDESTELTIMSGTYLNGDNGREADVPLLNGHVNITENPTLSKTPNGRYKPPRQYDAFDLSRRDDVDTTLDTIIEADTSTESHSPHNRSFLTHYDTSRTRNDSMSSREGVLCDRSGIASNNSFSKFPDDNMNSEVIKDTGSSVETVPTLEPNG